MARPRKSDASLDKKLAAQHVKEFRKELSILKKHGLTSPNLNVRKADPWSKTGKELRKRINKFLDVIDGRATTAKVSTANARKYKRHGYKVQGNRVIVPIKENQSVRSKDGDFSLITKHAKGPRGGAIEELNLKLDKRNIERWISGLETSRIKVGEDEALMFQYFGNNSLAYFTPNGETPQARMANYLLAYDSLANAMMEGGSKESNLIDNIKIFRVKLQDNGRPVRPPPGKAAQIESSERRRRKREIRKKVREYSLRNMTDAQYDAYLDRRMEHRRADREKLTGKALEEYRRKGRERAARSYRNRKGK